MRGSLVFTTLALCVSFTACSHKAGRERDTFETFTSQVGMSFVAPSEWKASDDGDTFTLKSPDGHALIQAFVFTSQGSGTMDEFCATMTASLLPQDATAWQESKWTPIKLGNLTGSKRELIPVSDANHRWRLYVLERGKYYYAINLNASEVAMGLNGEFYESVVCTFGIHD